LIFQRAFEIPHRTYVKALYATVAKELGYGFHDIYTSIVNSEKITFLNQDEEGVTIRGKRTPSDGFIDFNRSVNEVEKLIRAVSEPYPGAYCYYKDEKITFWEVEFDNEDKYSGTLGQILQKTKVGILVQFSDGNLWLNRATNENDAPIAMKFFRIGDKLGYNVQDEIYTIKKQLK